MQTTLPGYSLAPQVELTPNLSLETPTNTF